MASADEVDGLQKHIKTLEAQVAHTCAQQATIDEQATVLQRQAYALQQQSGVVESFRDTAEFLAAQSAEAREQHAHLQNELHVQQVTLNDTREQLVHAQSALQQANTAVDVVGQYLGTPTASPRQRAAHAGRTHLGMGTQAADPGTHARLEALVPPGSPARASNIDVGRLTASPRAQQQSQQLGQGLLDSLDSK